MLHLSKSAVFQTALHPTQQYGMVTTIGNVVYARSRMPDGSPVYVENTYQPTYFHPTTEALATHWGYDGKPLLAKDFKDIYTGKKYLDSAVLPIYGDINPEYMMLADVYGAQDVPHDIDNLYIWNIDLEVDSEHGFAKPDDPFAEITSITVQWRHMGQTGTVVYGRGAFTPRNEFAKVHYLQFPSEEELLESFAGHWRSGGDYPDIVTGWNIQFYDIPYLVNRMRQVVPQCVTMLSPFKRVQAREVMQKFDKAAIMDIKGVVIIDYLELYRKFRLVERESYRLDFIAHVELKKRKLSYEEVGSLRKLYRTDHQKFIEYNITDVWLVDELDQKLKFLELVCALAYTAKSNLVDTMKQVRLWDIMIYHRLRNDGFQIPPRRISQKSEKFAGAYVKEPKPGAYDWVVSFDVASMYPHIIRQWNLSPETKVRKEPGFGVDTITDLMAQGFDLDDLKAEDVCMAANGVVCRRGKEGFIPSMLKSLYEERKRFKKLQGQAKDALELETDPAKRKELEKQMAAYGNAQQVRKVNLNSAYGAMGSEYFRFYDIDLAEAVTVTGQMVIRWVANDLNQFLNRILKTKDKDYVIASDTDSVYLSLGDLVKQLPPKTKAEMVDVLDKICDVKFQPVIDHTFVTIAAYMNVVVPCLTMIRDVIADRGVWTAKKHYILNTYDTEKHRYKEPQLKMMGIETIKSSTPALVRRMLTEALQILMTGDQNALWACVKRCEEEFHKATFEDIARPLSANKLDEYESDVDKTKPIQVAGALCFNDALKAQNLLDQYEPIMSGEKIRYAYLRKPNPFHSHVMSATHGCPAQWNIEKWIDYPTQFEKVFLNPLEDILAAAGWTSHQESALF